MTGLVLGAGSFAAGALLLYTGRGLLSSVGSLTALALLAAAAGIWVGAPDGPVPGHRRILGRWTFAIVSLVIASFVATFWLQSPMAQRTGWGGPVAFVLLLAEPAYAMGALLAGLEGRRRGWLGGRWYAERAPGGRAAGVAVPATAGAALGVALAASWLIPSFPPGLVFLGLALVLTGAGSLEMARTTDPEEAWMAERVVIVTGVGDPGQVGYAVAEAFVARGARVLIVGRDEEVRDRARALGEDVTAIAADLTEGDSAAAVAEAAADRWGRVDVLVNVAGGLHVMKPVARTSPEEWDREVASNARTAFLMSRAALPLLRKARGSVINFASPAGIRAVGGMAAYSAAKAGVVALTRSLAKEEKDTGVRVNAIAPGMVDTAQNRAAAGGSAGSHWVSREQVVDVVLFLASEAGSGINGETIQVMGQGA